MNPGARLGSMHSEAGHLVGATASPMKEYRSDRRNCRDFDRKGRCKCSGLARALGHLARD